MPETDVVTRGLHRLRDWTYENYPAAYVVGTGVILYSVTFPSLQAFLILWGLVVALGLGLEPCVNPARHTYGASLTAGEGMRVALTFDDGPSENTAELLDVLAAEGVRATFFCLAEAAAKRPELLRRMSEEGHQVANHTITHVSLLTASPALARAEIERSRELLQSWSGQEVRDFRPPFGYRAPWTVAQVRRSGQRSVLWTINPRDFQNPGAETIVSRVMDQLSPGAIVLLHDGFRQREQTVEAVRRLIPELRQAGYAFARTDEM